MANRVIYSVFTFENEGIISPFSLQYMCFEDLKEGCDLVVYQLAEGGEGIQSARTVVQLSMFLVDLVCVLTPILVVIFMVRIPRPCRVEVTLVTRFLLII